MYSFCAKNTPNPSVHSRGAHMWHYGVYEACRPIPYAYERNGVSEVRTRRGGEAYRALKETRSWNSFSTRIICIESDYRKIRSCHYRATRGKRHFAPGRCTVYVNHTVVVTRYCRTQFAYPCLACRPISVKIQDSTILLRGCHKIILCTRIVGGLQEMWKKKKKNTSLRTDINVSRALWLKYCPEHGTSRARRDRV